MDAKVTEKYSALRDRLRAILEAYSYPVIRTKDDIYKRGFRGRTPAQKESDAAIAANGKAWMKETGYANTKEMYVNLARFPGGYAWVAHLEPRDGVWSEGRGQTPKEALDDAMKNALKKSKEANTRLKGVIDSYK